MWVRVLLIFAVIVLGIGTIRGENSVITYFELKRSQRILEETVNDLEKQNEALGLEITKIKQSPSYARKVLRDKYHLTDENEKIIFFAD